MENYLEKRDEVGTTCFSFISSLDTYNEKYDAAIFFIFQALASACDNEEQHRLILNEAGKAYRKAVKEVLANEQGYMDFEDVSIEKD